MCNFVQKIYKNKLFSRVLTSKYSHLCIMCTVGYGAYSLGEADLHFYIMGRE